MDAMTTSSNSRPAARLVLEDGTVFNGRAFGACDKPLTSVGEVVFNTAMTGYQEALTDPSYAGQLLTMTASMIGNYGVTAEDVESSKPQVAGFVIRELSRIVSNQRSMIDLHSWLAKAGGGAAGCCAEAAAAKAVAASIAMRFAMGSPFSRPA